MNSKLKSRYDAYTLAIAYLKENEEITKEVPAFAATFAVAKATLDAITENENRRQLNGKRVTLRKEQLHENLANQTQAIAAVIGSYATNQKDAKLLESVNFTASDLHYVTAQVLQARSTNVFNQAKELATQLREYGITEALLASFGALTEQYAAEMRGPRNEQAERRKAGEEIAELLQELDIIFNNQLDALMMLFRFSHRSFYNGYLIKREIQSPGHRKTRLAGLVRDKATGLGLAGVDVQVADTELGMQTGADGSFDMKLPPLSGSTVRFKKTGYKGAEQPFTLRRGLATNLAVELEKE